MMKKCPRDDCDRLMVPDEFYPPGAYKCPDHGGPIYVDAEIELATGPRWREGETKPSKRTELETLASWLGRLAEEGKLRTSIARDMSGTLPIELTIENHGPESIDIRFRFDPNTCKLIDVTAYSDKR